ncbi:SLC13 family permease [Fulvimarina endophytica]|uniref:SLC13 family permease n=1 Tax=Fulvimarina endophytica TaxID=2293836 RepID=UPI001314BFC0|nr:SLC13 family permease [Fulvimarina endophytica]
MTFDQIAIIVLMATLLTAFALDRFRVELLALSGLAAGTILGLVPESRIFSGFSDPAVITVAEILMIVQLLTRSHLVDWFSSGLVRAIRSELGVLATVCGLGAVLSMFMNNVGAFALMLPLTFSLSYGLGVRPGVLIMPLSFSTLLGGTCSLIGTPANLVVSGFHLQATGAPFSFFETAKVGAPVALIGLAAILAFAGRSLRGRGNEQPSGEIVGPRRFVSEFTVTARSSFAGLTLPELEGRIGGTVHTLLRDGRHVFGRRQVINVLPGDIVLADLDVSSAIEMNRKGDVEVAGRRSISGELGWIEAVVLPQSIVIGTATGNIAAFERHTVDFVAIAPQTPRIEGRLSDIALSAGDILLLRGEPASVRSALTEIDCLAIMPRGFGPPEPEGWATLAAFIGAIVVSALGLLAPQNAFGAAVLLLALSGFVRLRQAIADLNWPILIMLAAMIPLGSAVETTGAADVLATWLLDLTGAAGLLSVSLVILAVIVLVTPFVNNVSAAVAIAPVAIAVSRSSGVPAEPLLLLVAVGASLDFMTPFGHHNNTIAMVVGGYRSSDFLKFGAPLTLIVGAAAIAAVMMSG